MHARLLALGLLLTGCVLAPVDLSELPCPCGGGLVCDEPRNRCVEPFDAGAIDAAMVDGGSVDGGSVDAELVDAGSVDAGPVDSGPVDSGPVDAGVDAGSDAGGVDRIRNGSFEDTAGGWPSPWTFSVRTPAVATAMQSSMHAPTSSGAFSARIEVTTTGSPADAQLRQDVGTGYVGDTYVLHFSIRADAPGNFEVAIQAIDAPYLEHCAPMRPVTTSWVEHDVMCTLRGSGDAGVVPDGGRIAVPSFRVAFNLAGEANVFYLDDVTFVGP